MSEQPTYTEAEALNIAAMLFYRKACRALSDEKRAEIMSMIDEVAPGAREALMHAEYRADKLRDEKGGFPKGWPTAFTEDDEEDTEDEES